MNLLQDDQSNVIWRLVSVVNCCYNVTVALICIISANVYVSLQNWHICLLTHSPHIKHAPSFHAKLYFTIMTCLSHLVSEFREFIINRQTEGYSEREDFKQ